MWRESTRTAVALVALACVASPATAANIYVAPDGSGDVPTIQRAIDVATAYDVIILFDGVFSGGGNHDLVLGPKACRIRSASGQAANCVIDLQGHAGFSQSNPYRLELEDVTVLNGVNDFGGGAVRCAGGFVSIRRCRFAGNSGYSSRGGAIDVDSSTFGAASLLADCEFVGNLASGGGAAAALFATARTDIQRCTFRDHHGAAYSVFTQTHGYALFTDCVFTDNQLAGCTVNANCPRLDLVRCVLAHNDGGESAALRVAGADIAVRNSTFVDNGGGLAGDIVVIPGWTTDNLVIDRSLFAFARAPSPVVAAAAHSVAISCTDIYSTGAGWHASIAEHLGQDGNFDANPVICDLAAGNLDLAAISPCLPANNSCGAQIGYFGEGCAIDGYLVYPDGHGGLADIQTAIDVVPAGGEVLLAPGVYTGVGNRALDFHGKDLTLRSLLGDPLTCVIDAGGTTRCLRLHGDESPAATIRDLTFRGGRDPVAGGAVAVEGASPTFLNCRFEHSSADWGGGLAATGGASPVLRDCDFLGNEAVLGAALSAQGASIDATACTVAGNQALGAAVFVQDGVLRLERTLVAHNDGGMAVWVMPDAEVLLTSCDLYGNAGGDWTTPFADQLALRDNFQAPPGFCDLAAGVVSLCSESWCLPANNPTGSGLLVGAHATGCESCTGGEMVGVEVTGFYPRVEPGRVTFDFRMHDPSGGIPVVTAQQGDDVRQVCGLIAFNDIRFYLQDDHPRLAGGGQVTYRLYAGPDETTILREVDVTVPPLGGTRLTAHPNPFNPATTITYRADVAGPASLTVFDLRGRRVATCLHADIPVGEGQVIWTGRDDQGRAVEAGTYLCRLDCAGGIRTVAVTLVK